ncbi:FAD-dependent oxidoreductase [Pollutimonas sp. H1-120]|uniref:FAD-dependent oxidoreductase n=1 Tax=Pollutimonas sp. H1-120 TaxID=3148824 RepID=UPI003B52660E
MAATTNVHECDVLVIGSGAGGFSAAITARKAGLDVLMTEKAPVFGGTTATSGGYLWIPCNHLMADRGMSDDIDDARRYLREHLGSDYNEEFIESYLKNGPAMVRFFVEDMGVALYMSQAMPDYHPSMPGARLGRSLHAAPVSATVLGKELHRLRPLPRELSLFGMGVSSGSDLGHFYRFGRSMKSTVRVCTLLAKYGWDKLRYGRGQALVNGNALIARMARVLLDLGTPVWTFSPAMELLIENGRVVGASINRNGRHVEVRARRGVVLASGGFAQNAERRSAIYSHPALADEHVSLTASGNVGDGARMAEQAGGYIDTQVSNAGAWMPISKVPRPDGSWGGIIHSVNQGKPGMIAVLRTGRRFADESVSYHDFVEKLIKHPDAGRPAGAFLICDSDAFSRYGLGYAKPFLPLGSLLRSGYLLRAHSIGGLADKMGIDAQVLEGTVANYNAHARRGEDPEFGKGKDRYGHYLGDTGNSYNPNVAPLEKGPYYAVWMYAGDIGNFSGIRTDAHARALRPDGSVIPGLFAVGNDMASVFRGSYPGGGSLIGPAMTFGFVAARYLAGREEG